MSEIINHTVSENKKLLILPNIVYSSLQIANKTNNQLFFQTFYYLYPESILIYATKNNLDNFNTWFANYECNETINESDIKNILLSFINPIYYIEKEFIVFLINQFKQGILPNVPTGENLFDTLSIRMGKSKRELQQVLEHTNLNINDMHEIQYFKKRRILSNKEFNNFLDVSAIFLKSIDIKRLTDIFHD